MQDNRPYNERELLARIAEGDEKAFGELYKYYAPKIFSAAMSYTLRDKSLSEDIVQVLFIKVWTGRANLPAVKNIADYLFIAARNILFDTIKKRAAEDKMLRSAIQSAEASSADFSFIDRKDFDSLLNKALDSLPDQQRLVYRAARIDGISHDQVAAQMGLKLSTVRTHLKLATKAIRSFIAAHLSEPFIWVVAAILLG